MESFTVLDYIVKNVQIMPGGVYCPDPKLYRKVHTFLREAILDNHIPVQKIAGFSVIAGRNIDYNVGESTNLAHHPALGESYPELAKNMLDKVIISKVPENALVAELKLGENKIAQTPLRAFNYVARVIFTNPALATHIGDEGTIMGNTGFVNLKLFIITTTGYRSYAENSAILPDGFFPCATNASIADFVRVLPPEPYSNVITMRFYFTFRPDELMELFKSWQQEIAAAKLPKEELQWVQSFTI